LRDYVYDGESVWWLFARPMLYSLAVLICFMYAPASVETGVWPDRAAGGAARTRTKGPELQSGGWRADSDGWDFLPAALRKSAFGAGFRLARAFRIPRGWSPATSMIGDTGSGKSTAIRQILRQVQERGESAIVYDPAMDFVGEFYDPSARRPDPESAGPAVPVLGAGR
jgi:hypothetical protein